MTRGSYGDTVLLQLVAANTDSSQFAELVRHLVRPRLHLASPALPTRHLPPPICTSHHLTQLRNADTTLHHLTQLRNT